MSTLSEITEGWVNLVFKDKHTEQVARARAFICAVCPELKNKNCSKCGCYMPSKTRSMESKCPLNKW